MVGWWWNMGRSVVAGERVEARVVDLWTRTRTAATAQKVACQWRRVIQLACASITRQAAALEGSMAVDAFQGSWC